MCVENTILLMSLYSSCREGSSCPLSSMAGLRTELMNHSKTPADVGDPSVMSHALGGG